MLGLLNTIENCVTNEGCVVKTLSRFARATIGFLMFG